MTTPTGSLMLMDTASLYFRAFYGLPDSLRSPDGTSVNAVRGLLDMMARLVTDHRPTRLVACWDDDWRPAFRVEAIASYKAHRVAKSADVTFDDQGKPLDEEIPAALAPQVSVIVEVLAALGVARVGAPGFEADDVIGTLAAQEVARTEGEHGPVLVVTGDRDLFQLVDDVAAVRVLYTVRGIRNIEQVDCARLVDRYGVSSGSAYAELAMLRGDPSDGLPGVPGIGEKTAAALLSRYGSMDGILAARDTRDPGLTATQLRRLTEADDYLRVAPTVVRVVDDAPVYLAPRPGAADQNALTVPCAPADAAALTRLAQRWGLESSIRRVAAAFDWC